MPITGAVQRVLPKIEVPSSFEAVGHIAHYNLREQHMPYRKIIGQVCIDKNPSIKTVVTKVKEIANEFRVFDMEVIAGTLIARVDTHRPRPTEHSFHTCTKLAFGMLHHSVLSIGLFQFGVGGGWASALNCRGRHLQNR